jgi:hypothetical protein
MAAMVLTAAVLSAPPASAADLPPAPKSEPAQAPAAAGPLAPPNATCREWSDGCRTCRRAENGDVSCSNVGIACVPKEAACTASGTSPR